MAASLGRPQSHWLSVIALSSKSLSSSSAWFVSITFIVYKFSYPNYRPSHDHHDPVNITSYTGQPALLSPKKMKRGVTGRRQVALQWRLLMSNYWITKITHTHTHPTECVVSIKPIFRQIERKRRTTRDGWALSWPLIWTQNWMETSKWKNIRLDWIIIRFWSKVLSLQSFIRTRVLVLNNRLSPPFFPLFSCHVFFLMAKMFPFLFFQKLVTSFFG